MDSKALAKSKRAHSLHHSKRPHSNQKASSAGGMGGGNAKKQPGKQISEQSNQLKGLSRLPSNWDRYEEEFDSGSEDPSSNSKSEIKDVIVPKSKGGDYGELIAEAKSQSQSNSCFDSFAVLDDVVPDFSRGVGSLLSARGQGILSWIGQNDFIVDEGAAMSHEAPFLSLNLHALAEQLAKVDLSQRLFVEKDLLSPELELTGSAGVRATSNQETNQMQATSKGAKTALHESAAPSSEKGKVVDESQELMSSDTTRGRNPVPVSSNQGAKSKNLIKDSKQIEGPGQPGDLEFTAAINMISTEPKKKGLIFEAAAAEAELDMLLDSFGETNKFDSLGFKEKSSNAFPVLPTRTSIPPNLDDAFDDLFKETSSSIDQNRAKQPQEVKPALLGVQSSSSQSSPIVSDDFDSWLATI